MNCNKYYKKYKLNYDNFNLIGGDETVNDENVNDEKENEVVNEDIKISSVKLPFIVHPKQLFIQYLKEQFFIMEV